MKAALGAAHYLRQDIFEQEQARVFGRLWIFACLAAAIDADQAYAARRIGGQPVLIVSHQGRIRAFANRCPHRLMPLKPDGFGQGRMVCPYHGWVFSEDGKVKSVPKEAILYQYEPCERDELCLREYAVEVVGGFVFVNLDPSPIPITQQFSASMLQRLRDISGHFGKVLIHSDIEARYNWKLNFENVVDPEHVPYVHPRSFQPLLGKAGEDASAAFRSVPVHASPSASTLDQSRFSEMPMRVEPWPWHQQVDRFGPPDTYHNHFLFPNVNFISVAGLIFLVQQFEPVSPDRTQVRFTLCAAGSSGRIAALPAILRAHLNSEVQVLMEDVAFLERLQAHLTDDAPAARHGRYEHAVVGFGLAYLDWMKAQRPA